MHGVTPHRRPSVRQYRVAVAIAERPVTSASGAIAALRSVYPEDAEFRAAFADKTLRTTNRRDRRVARFLLFQLEQRASGRSFDLESARYDIEHVLPEHPGDDWRQFDERQRAACAYRLGNLTLLTAAHNRAASNAGYAAKRPIYQSSEFAITSRLAENYETWSAQKIRSRQAWMARQATAIWRIDSWPCQYSPLDYLFTFFGFVGLSIPAFLFAIVLVFTVYRYTGWAATGLFSAEFRDAAWSLARLLDMLKNLAIPLLVLSSSSAAALIRIHRATLLDELKKQYVVTARSKGVSELKVLFKYPVRVAINPLISTVGWLLPAAFGGEVVVSMVLNLPTTGPIMIESIMNEDMYLAGAIFMILSALTVVGTVISDLLLGIVDPRIRLGD